MILIQQFFEFAHIRNNAVGFEFLDRFALGRIADKRNRVNAGGFCGSDIVETVSHIHAGIMSPLKLLSRVKDSARFRFLAGIEITAENRSETM